MDQYLVLSFMLCVLTTYAGHPAFNGRLAAGPAYLKEKIPRKIWQQGLFLFHKESAVDTGGKSIAAYI